MTNNDKAPFRDCVSVSADGALVFDIRKAMTLPGGREHFLKLAGIDVDRTTPQSSADLGRVREALVKANAFCQGESSYTAYPEIQEALRILDEVIGRE